MGNTLVDYLHETGYDEIAVEPAEGGKGYWDVYVPEGSKGYYADTVPTDTLHEVRSADITVLDRRTRQQWTGDAR